MFCKRIMHVITAVMVLSAGLAVSDVKIQAAAYEELSGAEADETSEAEKGLKTLRDKNFEYIINADLDTVTVTGYDGIEAGQLVIPDTLGGKQVTKIGMNAFLGRTGFSNLV